MIETYTKWPDVPAHLLTKNQLAKLGLRPAPGQKAAAWFHSNYYHKNYKLYDQGQAVAKRKVEMTPARLAALKKAREAQYCKRCHLHQREADGLTEEGYCHECYGQWKIVLWARDILANPAGIIILDTETTGLEDDAEIVEISIITLTGEVLLDTLVQPAKPIPASASAIHGITNDMVATAPTWREVWPSAARLIKRASQILIWNSDFDTRLMEQSCRAHRLTMPKWWNDRPWRCAMTIHARWYGQWSRYFGSYKWQPLNGGHRALEDCQAVIRKLKGLSKDYDD